MVDANVEFSALYDMFSDGNLKAANCEYTRQAFEDMQPYIPMEFGDLRASGRVEDHETITWGELVYGPVQYYTQFQNYTTPGTGPYWDKVASGNHMTAWERAYLRGLGL